MKNVKARAKKYQRSIERKDQHVTSQAYLKRIAVIDLPSADGTRHPAKSLGIAGARKGEVRKLYDFQKRRFPNAKLEIHRERWAVMVGDYMEQSWGSHEMAKGHRDGLNFHYAKYLMIKDIPDIWSSRKS